MFSLPTFYDMSIGYIDSLIASLSLNLELWIDLNYLGCLALHLDFSGIELY